MRQDRALEPGGRAIARARVIVRGRVQGVGFRASAEHEARRRTLVGWVRNRSDDSVELECQGRSSDVDALIDWCRRGPTSARVIGLDVSWQPTIEGETAFAIRRSS